MLENYANIEQCNEKKIEWIDFCVQKYVNFMYM